MMLEGWVSIPSLQCERLILDSLPVEVSMALWSDQPKPHSIFHALQSSSRLSVVFAALGLPARPKEEPDRILRSDCLASGVLSTVIRVHAGL